MQDLSDDERDTRAEGLRKLLNHSKQPKINETQKVKIKMAQFPMGSDQLNELFSALCKAQGEIKRASKDGNNPHFRAKFASLESVVDASRDALNKYGLSVTQVTTAGDDGSLHLITMLGHISGQFIYGRYPVVPVKQDPQGFGSALSYAKRYSLAAIVGVVSSDEDDDGEAAMSRPAPQASEPVKVAPVRAAPVAKAVPKVVAKPKEVMKAVEPAPLFNDDVPGEWPAKSVVAPLDPPGFQYKFPVGKYAGKNPCVIRDEELIEYKNYLLANMAKLSLQVPEITIKGMIDQITNYFMWKASQPEPEQIGLGVK